MKISGSGFVNQIGVDHQVTARIEPLNIKKDLIRSIYDKATEGGCGSDDFTHARLVFSNFNAQMEPLN